LLECNIRGQDFIRVPERLKMRQMLDLFASNIE
jgi:hypothetical protein